MFALKEPSREPTLLPCLEKVLFEQEMLFELFENHFGIKKHVVLRMLFVIVSNVCSIMIVSQITAIIIGSCLLFMIVHMCFFSCRVCLWLAVSG